MCCPFVRMARLHLTSLDNPMAKTFRAKKKRPALSQTDRRSAAVSDDGLPASPRIGKAKLLLFLVGGTALAAAVYITAMTLHFMPIFHIYWAITASLILAFMVYDKYSVYRYTKDTAQTPDKSEEYLSRYNKDRRRIKVLLLVLLPFLFTVLGDMIYLFFLRDLDVIQAVKNLI